VLLPKQLFEKNIYACTSTIIVLIGRCGYFLSFSYMDRTGQSKKSQGGNIVIFRLFGQKPPLFGLKPKFARRVISLT